MSPTADSPDWAQPNAAQLVAVNSGTVIAGGTTIDVSAWASLVIQLVGVNVTDRIAVKYVFTTAEGLLIDQGALSANISSGASCTWQLPVSAAKLTLSTQLADSQTFALYGSNMPVAGKRMMTDFLPVRSFTLSGAAGVAANTFAHMIGGPADSSTPINDVTSYNGDCDFIARVFTTGGVTQWDFLVEILNLDGTLGRYIYTSLTSATTVTFAKGHPRAYVRWLARNTTATTGAWSLELDVIPKALA